MNDYFNAFIETRTKAIQNTNTNHNTNKLYFYETKKNILHAE